MNKHVKHYLHASLLAVSLSTALVAAPAFAQSKYVAESPTEPLHRRTIALCALALLTVHAVTRSHKFPTGRPQFSAGATPSSAPSRQTPQ
ncbi:hypothetical protein [Duganella sp. Leaf126]|uniref:hypothetical protein n=1 Tax=Duganella sp. Leaf126 TaxID=1736266 RepID=UPI0012E2ADB5|nr:hypothetical protein [Duganella sp. Leaf126]